MKERMCFRESSQKRAVPQEQGQDSSSGLLHARLPPVIFSETTNKTQHMDQYEWHTWIRPDPEWAASTQTLTQLIYGCWCKCLIASCAALGWHRLPLTVELFCCVPVSHDSVTYCTKVMTLKLNVIQPWLVLLFTHMRLWLTKLQTWQKQICKLPLRCEAFAGLTSLNRIHHLTDCLLQYVHRILNMP